MPFQGVNWAMFCREMSQAEGPAWVEVPNLGRSLVCVRNSVASGVAEQAKEKAVEGEVIEEMGEDHIRLGRPSGRPGLVPRVKK